MQSLYGGVSALSSFTSCNKNDTQDPVWKQTYLQAIGPTTRWGQAGTSPTGEPPAASSGRVISETCLWGMCQIRFLCNFQALNKWTSRAKCLLSLGSAFCTHTRACSQSTHALAGSGWAHPACISLCTTMPCVLSCLDVKRDSRGEITCPLCGCWQSGCRGLHSSSVFLFSTWLNGALHITCFTALPRTHSSPLHLSNPSLLRCPVQPETDSNLHWILKALALGPTSLSP